MGSEPLHCDDQECWGRIKSYTYFRERRGPVKVGGRQAWTLGLEIQTKKDSFQESFTNSTHHLDNSREAPSELFSLLAVHNAHIIYFSIGHSGT